MFRILKCVFIISIFQSCGPDKPQSPTVLSANSAFDLEKGSFRENVPKLYAKHILNANDVEYDSVRDGKLTDETLRYRISNTTTDFLGLTVPQKEFGYLYRSPELDSIAKFQNIYFKSLSVLTDKDRKPLAFYAETVFNNAKERKMRLNELIAKYGSPKYAFYISSEFNQCSYEWVLADRSIQVETSSGFGISTTSGPDGKTTSGVYYRFDMLIVSNKNKNDIYNAHLYELPDSIKYEGKYHSYKDFQLEKRSVFRDNFLLNSTEERYLKNEYGEYDISRAENDE